MTEYTITLTAGEMSSLWVLADQRFGEYIRAYKETGDESKHGMAEWYRQLRDKLDENDFPY